MPWYRRISLFYPEILVLGMGCSFILSVATRTYRVLWNDAVRRGACILYGMVNMIWRAGRPVILVGPRFPSCRPDLMPSRSPGFVMFGLEDSLRHPVTGRVAPSDEVCACVITPHDIGMHSTLLLIVLISYRKHTIL